MRYHNILIKTHGRSGSKTIVKFFKNSNPYRSFDYWTLNNKQITDLDHDRINLLHDLREEIPFNNFKPQGTWDFILSTRKDKFDQICSLKILEHTNQDRVYDKIHQFESPIVVSLEEIVEKYYKMCKIEQNWRKIGKTSLFRTFTEITYEELFSNNSTSLEELSDKIEYTKSYSSTDYIVSKSPYRKKELIKDYENLKKQFNKITVNQTVVV